MRGNSNAFVVVVVAFSHDNRVSCSDTNLVTPPHSSVYVCRVGVVPVESSKMIACKSVFTLLVVCTVCEGSPERNVHDDVLASLCDASKSPRSNIQHLRTPSLLQTSAATLQIFLIGNDAPLALYVTDAEGTIIALDAQHRSNVTLTVPRSHVSAAEACAARPPCRRMYTG